MAGYKFSTLSDGQSIAFNPSADQLNCRRRGGGHDADDRIVYDTTSGNLWYDDDGSGSHAAQLLGTLQGAPGVTAHDFTVT